MTPTPFTRTWWLHEDVGGPEIDPRAVELHRRLCHALARGDFQQALRLFRELSQVNSHRGCNYDKEAD